MRRRMSQAVVLILGMAAVAAFTGCDSAADDSAGTTREVVGDTTIVRSAGPGPWGEAELVEELRIGELAGADEYTFGRIGGLAVHEDSSLYVLDSQALEVRVYSADGAFQRRFGREGEGPGEFRQPLGVAFLPDDRLVIRDYGNGRINVFATDGTFLDDWSIPTGFFTTSPMFVDDVGHVYVDIIADRSTPGSFRTGLLQLDSTGAVVDTMRRPFADHTPPSLVAENVSGSGRSVARTSVPFWPVAVTTLNRSGEFVGGIADVYRLTTWHRDGTALRIEREVPRVPVDAAEAATAVERTTRGMRNTQADWKWEGPQPPAQKPFYRQVHVAGDGRLWVQTSQPARRVPPEPDAEPDAQGRPPLDQWPEPVVYDVFEADGSFLGTVRTPERFTLLAMRGDHVWGTVRDEYDVQYVTRYRITPS